MGHPARDVWSAALSLPEAERLELASHLIASVDGPGEPDWEAAWIDEIEQRDQRSSGPAFENSGRPSWSTVREHVLDRLSRR